MFGTTLLKRFLKFVLKRNVGKYLSSEIDLEQLDVKLDTGKLELKNLLLDCDAINKDLALGDWHVKAGYIGNVTAKLPLVSLSSAQCSVVVNEVVLTVAPKPPVKHSPSSSSPQSSSSATDHSGSTTVFPTDIPSGPPASGASASSGGVGGAMGFLLADDFGWTGHGAVMDGIKRIAGSLQSMLQHMRLEASNVLIRVELPHPSEKGRVVIAALKLDLVEFGELAAAAARRAGTAVTGASGAAAASVMPQPQGNPHDPRHPHSHDHAQHTRSPGGGSGASNHVANGSSGAKTGAPATSRQNGPTGTGQRVSEGGGGGNAKAASAAESIGRGEIAKHIQIEGLSLDLFEAVPLVTGAAVQASDRPSVTPAPPGGVPPASTPVGVTLVSGPGKHGVQLSVELRMAIHDNPRSHPTQICADVHLGAVRLQLLPSHAVCLSALKLALEHSSGGVPETPTRGVEPAAAGASGTELWASSASVSGACGSVWGQRSLFESIMMPDCEGVVALSLEPCMYGSAVMPYGDASEFHDACSRFGSLASSLVSSVTQTGTNLIGYVAASSSAAVGGAMDWMGTAGDSSAGVGQQTPQSPPGTTTLGLRTGSGGGAGPGHVGPAPARMAPSGSGATPPAPSSPPSLPPVIKLHVQACHTALVLCYSPQHSSQQSATRGSGPHRTVGAAVGGPGQGPAGGSASTAAAASPRTISANGSAAATAASSAAAGAGGGSLVVELHDVACDAWLDAPYGNGLCVQAGQLAVFEQLPASVGTRLGITAAEWSRVPEVLPQAPHRFRPTQPSPTGRVCGNVSSPGAAGIGARLGEQRMHGRKAHHGPGSPGPWAGGGGSGNGGAVLQTWPILSCASTTQQAATSTNAVHGKAHAANKSPAPSIPGGGGAASGFGCLRLRACWGGRGGTAASEYGTDGNGRYNSDREGHASAAAPSYDLAMEILPVTVWLSPPLVQRISDFVAPLMAEGGHVASAQAAPKPHAPLPRLSLTVTAPHVCVLLALVPAGRLTEPAPRVPGAPVFVALDIVSPPYLPGDRSLAHDPVSHHPYPHGHGHLHTPPHYPHAAGLASPSYGCHVNGHFHSSGHPMGAPHGHGSYGTGAGWPTHGSHPYDHVGAAAYHMGGPVAGLYGQALPGWLQAGSWPAVPPASHLLTVYQAPATDRLMPSQVTTVDVTAGVVELLLVRTGRSGRGQHTEQRPPHATPQPDAAGPWTSKLLLSLSLLPPPVSSPSAGGPATPWGAHHTAPPTGPADVPPGCGLHLHVSSDPGIGTAPDELVSEAWGHVTTHAQDRWGDPEGEGGAWEDRSSFRSVAFHERCRKSSATFLHLRAPKALLHLTRADMTDLVALPAAMALKPSPSDPGLGPAGTSLGTSRPRAGPAPPSIHAVNASAAASQTCALLEVCLKVQLQDDPPPTPPVSTSGGGCGHASGNCIAGGSGAVSGAGAGASAGATAAAARTGSTACGPGAGPTGLTAAGGACPGLGLGGSRVEMYELRLEELTVFRAASLGGRGGCDVTSVHAHGVTLTGYLEPQAQAGVQSGSVRTPQAESQPHTSPHGHRSHGPHPQLRGQGPDHTQRYSQQPQSFQQQQQQQQPSSGHWTQQSSGLPGSAGARGQSGAAAASGVAAAAPEGAGVPRGRAICLLHCPLSAGAADKAPSYVEYVCVQGVQPSGEISTVGTGGTAREMAALGVPARMPSSGGTRPTLRPAPTAAVKTAQEPMAIHSVLLQGLTVSTDHGYVTMDWAAQLGTLFESIAVSPPATAASSAAKPSVSTPQPCADRTTASSTAMSNGHGYLSVNIVDLALRHEPLDYPDLPTGGPPATASGAAVIVGGTPAPPVQQQRQRQQQQQQNVLAQATGGAASGGGRVSPVAVAFIIEAVHFGLPLGGPPPAERQLPSAPTADSSSSSSSYTPAVHTVVLHSMTLHLAAADQRGPGWAASDPRAIREPLLQGCGYHRVLQETQIKVVARQRRYPRRPTQPSPPSAAGLAAMAAASATPATTVAPCIPGDRPAFDPASDAANVAADAGGGAGPGCGEQQQHLFHTTLDVEITNQHLLGVLTVESATLLAHFAMQAGTLMTARQAAAVAAAAAAAGPPLRRDGAGRSSGAGPNELYWDAASETGSSSAVGAANGGGAGFGGTGASVSDAGGDAAGSLLTALLLDEVEENAFRHVVPPAVAAAGASALTSSGMVPGQAAAWYAPGGGSANGRPSPESADNSGGGLILIDDFFPVNHQGEYDEDLTLVETPPELMRDGRGGGWRPGGVGVGGAMAELEGTWYGPNEGPDQRPSSRATSAQAAPACGGPLHHTVSASFPKSTCTFGAKLPGATHVPPACYPNRVTPPGQRTYLSLSGCSDAAIGAGFDREDILGFPFAAIAADADVADAAPGSSGGLLYGSTAYDPAWTDVDPPDIDDLLSPAAAPITPDMSIAAFHLRPDPRSYAASTEGLANPTWALSATVAATARGVQGGRATGPGSTTAAPSVVSVVSSAATGSIFAPTWRLQEDYVRVPRKSDEDGASAVAAAGVSGVASGVGGGGSVGVAPGHPVAESGVAGSSGNGSGGPFGLAGSADQPPPLTRITFKDLSGIWVMHTTRSPSSPSPTAPTGAAAAAGGSSPSGQQEGRVELVVEGLGLLLETYGPGGHLARHMKVSVHDLEIRDCALEARQQQASAAAAAAVAATAAPPASAGSLASIASSVTGAAAAAAVGGVRARARARARAAAAGGGAGGSGGWVRVLGYRAVRGQPRDSRAPLVAVALTAVRPNPAACDPLDEEFRLAVALLPLRLKLNQDILSYLTWYSTSVSAALKPAASVLSGMQTALSELGGCEPLPPPYFQRVQIRGFNIMLDYRPRRVDIAALAEGRLLELLNLVPLGGVDLACRPLVLAGVQGWDGLGAAVLREWLNDIARTQAHKFITGLAPVNAVVKVGSAVATLLAAPARHLARREAAAGRQLAASLRRTSATFATRLVYEAMAVGRKAAAGAGKALARVGSNTLVAAGAAGSYGGSGYGGYVGQGYDGEEGEGMEGGRDAEGAEEGEEDDTYGEDEDEYSTVASAASAALYDEDAAAAAAGANRMRRTCSASSVMRQGLTRAAVSIGSASQQVAAAAGLQRSVSTVARALSVASAAPASAAAAAFQVQLKGTFRSVRRALKAQLMPPGAAPGSGGGSGGGVGGGGVRAGGAGSGPVAGGGYPQYPRPKED